MLYFHCYDKNVMSKAFSLVQTRMGDADAALLALKEDLLGPLNAGSLACERSGVPALLRLLAIRKEVQQLDGEQWAESFVLVYEDESQVPVKFADLGPTFELFGVSLREIEEQAGEVGLIPPKLDLQIAFGVTDQSAETASWF